MPFVNTDQPAYESDQPAFMRLKKKAGFDAFVASCIGGQEIPEERFSELWNLRWKEFSQGGIINEHTLFIDIVAADRLGYTVDLQLMYEQWLKFLDISRTDAKD